MNFTENVQAVDVVIANGASLSGEVNISGVVVCAIEIPASFAGTGLTFQAASAKGGTFREVYLPTGAPLTLVAAANQIVTCDPVDFAGLRNLKVRAGTVGSPSNQSADRTLKLLVRPA